MSLLKSLSAAGEKLDEMAGLSEVVEEAGEKSLSDKQKEKLRGVLKD